jgi:hypothetical protein
MRQPFAATLTHRLPLSEAAKGYDIFLKKEDRCEKVVLSPDVWLNVLPQGNRAGSPRSFCSIRSIGESCCDGRAPRHRRRR